MIMRVRVALEHDGLDDSSLVRRYLRMSYDVYRAKPDKRDDVKIVSPEVEEYVGSMINCTSQRISTAHVPVAGCCYATVGA